SSAGHSARTNERISSRNASSSALNRKSIAVSLSCRLAYTRRRLAHRTGGSIVREWAGAPASVPRLGGLCLGRAPPGGCPQTDPARAVRRPRVTAASAQLRRSAGIVLASLASLVRLRSLFAPASAHEPAQTGG